MATAPKFTDAEILSQFRDFMARQNQGPEKFDGTRNHPLHRGLVEQNYVRPAPTEFPKMMHHPSGLTKIVQNRDEQQELENAWTETPSPRKVDWRSKLGEVATKSGFPVKDHHVIFLQNVGVEAVENVRDAAQFLDQLSPEEQEQFFREAEMQDLEPLMKKPGRSKKKDQGAE